MTAYDIVQVPGWENLSLRPADASDLEARLDTLAHDAVPDDVPRDTATPFRAELRKHLARVTDRAREAGASVVSLPTQRMGGLAVPASYTVSEVWNADEGSVGAEEVLAALAADSTAAVSIVDVDGQPALREEDTAEADPRADPLATHAGRRVRYTVAAPEAAGSWVVFAFVTIGDGDPLGPLADALVDLFDAVMGTVRWH